MMVALYYAKKGETVRVRMPGHNNIVTQEIAEMDVVCGATIHAGDFLTMSRDGYAIPVGMTEDDCDMVKERVLREQIQALKAEGKSDEEIADIVFQ